MLRVLLVVSPGPEQYAAIARALATMPIAQVYAPPEDEGALPSVTSAITGALGGLVQAEARLLDGPDTIDFVEWIASQEVDDEQAVVMLASVEVVREVVIHALQAPVAADRLRFEPGTFAEVEVRLDAPWTVNRLNDGCHLDGWSI